MHRFRSLSSKARHRFQRAIAEWPAMKLTGLSHIVIWHKYLKSKLLLKWFLSVPCVLAIHIELYKHIIYTSIPTFKSLCYLVGFFLLSHVIYEFRTRIMYVLLFIPVFFFFFEFYFGFLRSTSTINGKFDLIFATIAILPYAYIIWNWSIGAIFL